MPSPVKWLKIRVSNLEKNVGKYAQCPFQWWLAARLITRHCSNITAISETSCRYTTNTAHEPAISLCWTRLSQLSLQMWISWQSVARILIQLLLHSWKQTHRQMICIYTYAQEGIYRNLARPCLFSSAYVVWLRWRPPVCRCTGAQSHTWLWRGGMS